MRYLTMVDTNKYFGNPDQQALERRADLLWQIVKGDTRYSCHGRAVALIETGAKDENLQIALARLQGVGPSPRLTPEVMQSRKAAIEGAGLVTDFYDHWSSDVTALLGAKNLLANRTLPVELTVHEVGADTTDEDFRSLDVLTQSCGVLLPAANFLRGAERPAACVYAKTAEGEAVGVAAAIAENPASSSEASRAWWGMLSTAESWRGRGIAKLLGAMAMVALADRHNVQFFGTGIRPGNTESAKLCEGLGFSPTGLLDLIAIDPDTMSGGRMTK
jgi:GNAT superfamily N-acetyltransferase